MKVLIVDDERAIRNSLGEILTDEGYEVDTAEDGAVALQKVEKEKFDVIFCDIKMPGMDGIEVLGKLTEMGIDAAVVMISGHADIDTALFLSGGTTNSNSIFRKKKDYLYLVRKNGGNSLQAWTFYLFLVATQVVKKCLSPFGGNFAQKLRYRKK